MLNIYNHNILQSFLFLQFWNFIKDVSGIILKK